MTVANHPEQLHLDGFDALEARADDLFRLDDETCRIGLINVARMRRILDAFDADAA